MPFRVPSPRQLLPVALTAATALTWALLPAPARSEVLYTLETQCSLKQGAAQACTVEATEQDGTTLYRHTIGDRVVLIRIEAEPSRMSLWNPSNNLWTYLTSAGALLSSNTVCFNGMDLCVVNPNYLNSLVEEKPALYEGRDLVRVKFGIDGRVDLSCFDTACAEVN
ncbi:MULTISPECIES: hypothetical protein [unclassified Cyanobium]|uniref:hypothetical protein n=1 Tax=unclassified Cyanobium TaxID=2627006 RepID=UPI001647C6D4|nr:MULTISPECIES: hypothetical protein [unclassified Cyanobium]MBE9154683.1 hypothetical protein [Cyanobium sp. LEGE 06113]QNI70061.1 hypothetical protein CyaNS01_00923 [Cyanobium sp. NS01]